MTGPRILALDLSLSRTGWATDEDRGVIRATTTGTARLIDISDQVLELAAHSDVACVEGYAYARPHQAHQLGELGGVVRVALHELGVPIAVVAPSALKRYATGSGAAPKAAVLVAAVRRLGYTGSDDNIADAMWLHALAAAAYSRPVVDMPREQTARAVAAVDWPTPGEAP